MPPGQPLPSTKNGAGEVERIDDAPCGYLEFADDGSIRHVNNTLAAWLRLPPRDLVGRPLNSILTVANRIFLQTHFFPLLTLQGHAEEIFLTLLTGEGATLPVITSAQRRTSPGGNCNQCVFLPVRQRRKYEDEVLEARRNAEAALANNAELRAAQQGLEQHTRDLERRIRQVEERNEELQRVSHILSHDLREPIRKIEMFADLARGQLGPVADVEALEALRKIDREAGRVECLTGAIRQYLDAEPSGQPTAVNLGDVAEKAAASVALKLSFSDWVLTIESLPEVEGHRELLQLLFSHLLENAIKFRAPSRRLRVRIHGRVVQENVFVATRDRYCYVDFARIEVRDNGLGFDPKYQGYVFQLLKKVHLDTPGHGVGLATCRKIAALHYGSIRMDATPDVGATFVVLLPLAQ